MSRRLNISIFVVAVLVLSAAVSSAGAQDSSTQTTPGTTPTTVPGTVPDSSQEQPSTPPESQSTPPVPAYGQSGAAPIAENPPISALDQPALGPPACR